ncbi:hypothetical protein TWF730_000272 [Orbilia blumenaviensis]|uniref:CARDB domain-containing protein n=1 Tax=Orbilia blumenaviensis TaxID=1796055 RepID=A0AAV9VS78_9PEZI
MSAPPAPDVLSFTPPQGLPPYASQDVSAKDEVPIPVPPILTPSPPFRPPPITWPPIWPIFRWLNGGAWLINLEPTGTGGLAYDGTIRIENHANGRTASGDLYQRPRFLLNIPGLPSRWITLLPPNPASGIPIQGRKNYRYYLRITQIDESISIGKTFKLGFQKYKYSEVNKTNFTFTQEPANGNYTATMTWKTAPAGYPYLNDYAEGDVVLDGTSEVEFKLKMGRVSEFYRKITVEIDNVPNSEKPLDNGVDGAGHEDWNTVFARIGFEAQVIESDSDIAEPSEVWSPTQSHQTMLARRDANNLDVEWRYYLLATKYNTDGAFGIMFDNSASDSNNIPREGVQVSSHIVTGSQDGWGAWKNTRYGAAKGAYFRTALHELGHAFGLLHNDDGGDRETPVLDFSFMNQTGRAVGRCTAANPLVNNIKWNHADRNLFQIRHWPDVFVRPGGVEFGYASNTRPPITPVDNDTEYESPDLVLAVEPLNGHSEIPLGAPVRINLTLKNIGEQPVEVPGDISLKSHHVVGEVTDPTGTTRGFHTLFYLDREEKVETLEPGNSVVASLTLLRGGKGALFPVSGVHRVAVKVSWGGGNDTPFHVAVGETTVMVTPPLDKSHAAAAHKLLTTPDAHLVLILGGDYLEEGVNAIKQALEDDTLRKHFACTEAKRVLKQQNPDFEKANGLVSEEDIVLSETERRKLENLGVEFPSNLYE